MTDERSDYLFKVLLCGDSGVGNCFMDSYLSTIGVDFVGLPKDTSSAVPCDDIVCISACPLGLLLCRR